MTSTSDLMTSNFASSFSKSLMELLSILPRFPSRRGGTAPPRRRAGRGVPIQLSESNDTAYVLRAPASVVDGRRVAAGCRCRGRDFRRSGGGRLGPRDGHHGAQVRDGLATEALHVAQVVHALEGAVLLPVREDGRGLAGA